MPSLRIADFTPEVVETLALRWLDAIAQVEATVPVEQLYGGPFWSRLRNLPWAYHVVSAGLGMVGPEEAVPSYDASFSSGLNQVGRSILGFRSRTEAHIAWYSCVNTIRRGTKTPLTDLLSDPEAWLLVILGESYRQATSLDVALAQLLHPSRVLVLGTPEMPLPGHARRVYGTPSSLLPIRHAEWLLTQSVEPSEIRCIHVEWCNGLQSYSPQTRIPISAPALEFFISERQGTSQRTLLRMLRQDGWACSEERLRAALGVAS